VVPPYFIILFTKNDLIEYLHTPMLVTSHGKDD